MSGHGVMCWAVTAGIPLSARQLTFVETSMGCHLFCQESCGQAELLRAISQNEPHCPAFLLHGNNVGWGRGLVEEGHEDFLYS